MTWPFTHLKYRLLMAIPFLFCLMVFWLGENSTSPLGIPFWTKVAIFSELLYLPLFMCETVEQLRRREVRREVNGNHSGGLPA